MSENKPGNLFDPFGEEVTQDPFAPETVHETQSLVQAAPKQTAPVPSARVRQVQVEDVTDKSDTFDPNKLEDTVFLEDSDPDVHVPVYADLEDDDDDYLIQDIYDDYEEASAQARPNPEYTIIEGGNAMPGGIFSAVFLSLMSLCIACAAFFGFSRYLKENAMLKRDTFYRVSIGDAVLTGMQKDDAADYVHQTYSEESAGLSLQFIGDSETFSVPLTEFSPVYDTDEIIEEAWAIGRSGTREQRLREIYASNGVAVHYAAPCKLNEGDVQDFVTDLALQIDVPVKEPSIEVNPENNGAENLFLMEEEQTGRELDEAKLYDDIINAVKNDFQPIRLSVETLEPSTTLEALKENVQLMRSFTTKYDYLPNRVYNIHRATDTINGTVIQPGEVFSFNGIIGNTSIPSNGYKEWYVIIGGKSEMDYGGGVCQAATTLYNAAVRCDMEILERAPHSIASSYVPRGQDATIAYGAHDMSFRNTSDYPIYIFGNYTNTSVTFMIYGRPLDDGVTIEMESELLGTHSPGDPVITQDSSKPVGYRETTVTALNGYDVRVYKVWFDKDGKKIDSVVDHTDSYPSRRAEITVGPSAPASTPTPVPTSTPDAPPPDDTPDGE